MGYHNIFKLSSILEEHSYLKENEDIGRFLANLYSNIKQNPLTMKLLKEGEKIITEIEELSKILQEELTNETRNGVYIAGAREGQTTGKIHSNSKQVKHS
ncbi:MAG: hypothetical protein DRP74_09170 [Candidatus Omnitrophota bacterium]|nr:MAG: hypothetical protein DRP74_09170 [Candidatus Omnitrophota bacterium]